MILDTLFTDKVVSIVSCVRPRVVSEFDDLSVEGRSRIDSQLRSHTFFNSDDGRKELKGGLGTLI